MALTALAAIAQNQESYSRLFAAKFVEETNGFIQNKGETNKTYIHYIQMPSFYDFDLVRMSSRRIVNRFSDVKMALPWEYDPEKDRYSEMWETDDGYAILIVYSKKDKILIVAVTD